MFLSTYFMEEIFMTVILKDLSSNELVAHLKGLTSAQKNLDIEILRAMSEVLYRRLHLLAGFPNLAEYCETMFGLSKNCAWKRTQAVKVIDRFPQLMTMLKDGKTHVSHIAMLSPIITEANQDKILGFLPNASKKELEFFLSTIGLDGGLKEVEATVEVRIRCSKALLEKLERAKGLVSSTFPGEGELAGVLDEALEALLDKKDPMRKAERAKKREAASVIPSARSARPGIPSLERGEKSPERSAFPEEVAKRVPTKTRYEVYLRAGGQCEWVCPETGRRCSATTHLQYDHVRMRCRGGSNDPNNGQMLCAQHNLLEAELQLGRRFIRSKIGFQQPESIC